MIKLSINSNTIIEHHLLTELGLCFMLKNDNVLKVMSYKLQSVILYYFYCQVAVHFSCCPL